LGLLAEYIKEQAEKKHLTPAEWYQKNIALIPRCSLATHVGKYAHPNTKVFLCDRRPSACRDYVTTTSAAVPADIVCSSAAYMSAAKLLLCNMEDSRPLIEHVLEDDPAVYQELQNLDLDPGQLADGVKKLVQSAKMPEATDCCLRQVYFPVGDKDYQLLTPLPQSSLLAALNKRYWEMNRKRKESRTSGGLHYGESYAGLPGCVIMKFGGSKPQNISTLNNENHGRAPLLPSLPPSLKDRLLRLPHRDFFNETVPYGTYRDLFMKLHQLFGEAVRNNVKTREQIREVTGDLVDVMLQYCWQLRAEGAGWSDGENRLPLAQKIWLDDKYEERRKDKEWIQTISADFGRWMVRKYQAIVKYAKGTPVVLGDAEMHFFATMLEDELQEEVRYQS
jgi:CRISPR-associated protein Csy1